MVVEICDDHTVLAVDGDVVRPSELVLRRAAAAEPRQQPAASGEGNHGRTAVIHHQQVTATVRRHTFRSCGQTEGADGQTDGQKTVRLTVRGTVEGRSDRGQTYGHTDG